MSPIKRRKTSSTTNVGNVHHISGSVNIAGGDINTREETSIRYDTNAEIVKALSAALEQTHKRQKTSRARKSSIEKEVKEIEAEIGKKKIDQGFLAERFRSIAQMAPDILDVIIASLGNPAAVMGVTVKKIAEKAKAENAKK
jgi:hypothetical protein